MWIFEKFRIWIYNTAYKVQTLACAENLFKGDAQRSGGPRKWGGGYRETKQHFEKNPLAWLFLVFYNYRMLKRCPFLAQSEAQLNSYFKSSGLRLLFIIRKTSDLLLYSWLGGAGVYFPGLSTWCGLAGPPTVSWSGCSCWTGANSD